jgi:hypothetical protein
MGRDPEQVLDEGFFEYLESSWCERKLPVGATCSVGVFEGQFIEDFMVARHSYPRNIRVESLDFYDRGMSYGGPPFKYWRRRTRRGSGWAWDSICRRALCCPR